MLDTLTMYNRDDFNQRYARSYGWFIHPETGAKTLVYVRKVERDKVTFETEKGEFYAYSGTNVQFEFLPITRGWFHTSNFGPVILQRVPAKQFSRGISDSNTSVRYFGLSDSLREKALSLGILQDVFGATPVTKPNLQDFFANPALGFIMNPYFLLWKDGVFFYDVQVGTITGEVITLTDSIIKQELQDYINRNDYRLRIA